MKKFVFFIIKCIVILAILAVGGYYSFNILMSAFVKEKAEVLVPDLKGKNLEECLEILSQSKLALIKEGAEYNQDIPAGIIIRQVPPAGMNVKEGKSIRIVISQGGETVYVPDLRGQTMRAATISLRTLGLVLGELTTRSSMKYEEGIVLNQNPIPGSSVEKGSFVNVLMSNGKPTNGTVLMPDWFGKSAVEAKKWAMDENEVFKQTPKFDEKLTSETKIVFYVADEKSSLALKNKNFEYVVPDGKKNKRIRLVLSDENGDRDIFNGVRAPNAKISIPVKVNGKARVKVFINNISIEEIDL